MPKISALTAGTTPDGTELIAAVQGGATVRLTLSDVARQISLQSVTSSSDTVSSDTTVLAVQRTAPSTTALALPPGSDGQTISIVDWSVSVTDHAITLTPDGSQTIMRVATWTIYSNTVELSSLTIRFSSALNGWFRP